MTRKRIHNKGLPKRWDLRSGSYYYRPHAEERPHFDNKHFFLLGRSLAEAHEEFAKRIRPTAGAPNTAIRNFGQLFEEYLRRVVPHKSPNTQESNRISLNRLTKVFSALPIEDLKPSDVYKYAEKAGAKTSTKRDVEVLSHAMTMATQWGIIDANPIKGQIRLGLKLKPRSRNVEAWEIRECLSLKPLRAGRDSTLMMQAYIKIKILSGLRSQDLLTLQKRNVTEEGLRVAPLKTRDSTGKTLLIQWSPELRAAIDEALALRAKVDSEWVISTEAGDCYYDLIKRRAPGFKAMWKRFIDRCLKETELKEHFTEHDLRAVAATSSESLADASALLGHSKPEITRRVYRRGEEKVKPAKNII